MKNTLIILLALLLTNALYSQHWNPQVSGTDYDLRSIKFPSDNNVGFASGGRGTILKTLDGGSTWNKLNTGTGYDIFEMHFFNNEKGFAVGSGNVALSTIDGGNTWSKLNLTVSGEDYYRNVVFLDENVGYITGGTYNTEGVILKTTDGGLSWLSLPVNSPSGAIYGLCFTSREVGYFSNYAGEIKKTTDGGATWHLLISGFSKPLIRIYFTDENTGFACGDQGAILKTTNAGVSWTKMTQHSDNYLHDILFIDEFVGYSVGGNVEHNTSTIFKTIDGGQTWNEDLITTSRLTGVDLSSFNKGYVCGFDGAIYKIKDEVYPVDSAATSFELASYPNPVKNTVTIKISGSEDEYFDLSITNGLGMNLRTEQISVGLTEIDLTNIGSNGLYYLVVRDSRKNKKVKKVILID